MAIRGTVSRVSFAGGELSSTAAARDDFGRYQNSVERCENLVVMQEGGLTRAPGTRYVKALHNEAQRAKHLPFRFSTTDYYTLIVNGGKAEIVRAGGFVQNPDTTAFQFDIPWTEAQLASLRSARETNNLYVVCPTRRPQVITRSGLTDWACADYSPNNGPVQDQNLSESFKIVATGVLGNVTLTSSGGDAFTADMVGSVIRLDTASLDSVPQWLSGEAGVGTSAERRYNGNVYACVATADAGFNPPEHLEGVVLSGQGKASWTYLHSDAGYVRISAFTAGHIVQGSVLGRLPTDVAVGSGTHRWYLPAWSDSEGWPNAIAFAGDRLGFFRGAEGWFTGLDGTLDMEEGRQFDDDAFRFKLKAPDASEVSIRGAASFGFVMLLASDQEWVLRGANVSDVLTPTGVRPVPDTTNGAADIEPVVIDGGVLFVGRTRKRLHFAKFNREGQKIEDAELSAFARHIFAVEVAGIAWQRDPHRILWIWFVDGTVAAMTYVPQQEILAFVRRPFVNGFVEEISCVPSTESGTDEVTLTVRRTIAGQTRRYIEQFVEIFAPEDANEPTGEGAWFVDSGLRFQVEDGDDAVTSIGGLGHLRGQEVAVWADGAEQSHKTVENDGTIDLDRAARDVIVGLPTEWYVRDLPRNFDAGGGSTRGKAKNAHQALIQYHQTYGGEIRVYDPRRGVNGVPDNGQWNDIRKSAVAGTATPAQLVTGMKQVTVSGNSREEAQLEARGRNVGPVTILALSPTIDVEQS